MPNGYALGGIEGRVAIHYVNSAENSKDNFSFKCHRSSPQTVNASNPQEIFAVSFREICAHFNNSFYH